ncbi:MAG: SDR family oxidoreductase [Bacteroidota bacterium]
MNQKVAVITGGSGTLGKAMAKGLAEQGVKVFLLGRNLAAARAVAAEFTELGYQADAVQCDVVDEAAVENAAKVVLQSAGKVDILVNCAGGNMRGATVMPDQSIFDISVDQFRKVSDLNLMGSVIPTIAFAKTMVEQKQGCIINISSMASFQPLTRVIGYSASKAAINNFTQWMAVELAQKYGSGIRVNAIAPGFFIAKQNRALLLNDDDTLTQRGETIISQTPMKRFGNPEDLVSTLLWLCDDQSSFVTGIVVPVDGGYSAFSGV